MINETLNNAEIEIAQAYFKSMLSNTRRAVSKYGADAEKIMWGSAVKRAKKKMEDINTNKIKEAVTKALSYNLDEVVKKIDSMLDEANMNEATEEEIERQKEYNAELEKTDSLVSQISTKSQLRETIKSYIKEKLTKKSKVGDFIDDFTKSDAKQFKGKSEKKKQEMAVAAYLAKQNKK